MSPLGFCVLSVILWGPEIELVVFLFSLVSVDCAEPILHKMTELLVFLPAGSLVW